MRNVGLCTEGSRTVSFTVCYITSICRTFNLDQRNYSINDNVTFTKDYFHRSGRFGHITRGHITWRKVHEMLKYYDYGTVVWTGGSNDVFQLKNRFYENITEGKRTSLIESLVLLQV